MGTTKAAGAKSPDLLSKGMSATYSLSHNGEAEGTMNIVMLEEDAIEVTASGPYPPAMYMEQMILIDALPLVPLTVYRR